MDTNLHHQIYQINDFPLLTKTFLISLLLILDFSLLLCGISTLWKKVWNYYEIWIIEIYYVLGELYWHKPLVTCRTHL